MEIKIQDESGDKKYFTQLPHYVLNHSTAIDQALYWQMKRYAGENGKCFATQETLIKKLGIGTRAYNKSLKYLIDKNWVKFIGMTKGKTRPIKTYAIIDIWKLNINNYEKILVKSTVSFNEILAESIGDTCQKHSKILAESTIEEEQYKEELEEEGEGDKSPTNPQAYSSFKEEGLPKEERQDATREEATPRQQAVDYFTRDDAKEKMFDYLVSKGYQKDFLLKEMNKFNLYWAEMNGTGKKQRWELEKTFEIKKRLLKWLNNNFK